MEMLERKSLTLVLSLIVVVLTIGGFYLLFGSDGGIVKDLFSSDRYPYPRLAFTISSGNWGTLKTPVQVLSYRGQIYVADAGRREVLVFNAKGEYLFRFEQGVPVAKRVLRYPYGLAADENGRLFVADLEAGKIRIFNLRGEYQGDFNADNKHIVRPAGLFYRDGRLYVTDIGFNRVYAFDRQGNLLLAIGSGRRGAGKDEFSYPNALTVDRQGNIYVSDTGNNRVVVYDSRGQFREILGSRNDIKLSNPRGIALDSAENVYVASTMTGSVKVMEKKGLALYELISGRGYSFELPSGLCIDQFDNIYVTDRGRKAVYVFKGS